ncbi:MAG TPA: glycosyltransferase [Candidatus Binatia bacterium]|jgi:glycosyltransferase involved in cell wall biosynthesis
MTILFLIGGAFRTLGGALVTTVVFARKLQRDFGHRAILLSRHPVFVRESIGGVEVTAYRDIDELKAQVKEHRPDIIVGALDGATDGLRVASRYGIPCALYLHGYEFCPPTAAEREAWGIRAANDASFPTAAEADFVLRSADERFACSKYLQDFYERRHRLRCELIYGDFDVNEIVLDGPRQPEYIAGVCGYRHKGLEIFLDLAERFPDQRFLLAGSLGSDIDLSYRGKIERLSNLYLPGRQTIKDLLVQAKLVLVPSLLPEPFGRIAVEAMANDVPILASDTGGISEILGDAPMRVGDFRDTDVWVDRVGELIDSDDLRAIYGREGKNRARGFIEANSTAALETRLRRLAAERRPDFTERVFISFYGDADRAESDSLVNTRWSRELAAREVVATFRPASLDVPDITVHHDYTRHFTAYQPPDGGALVAVRTSDFGPYPPAWAEKINSEFDQLWVHTNWIREQAIGSGIDARRVRIVPHGVEAGVFSPDGPHYSLPTKKSFRFLFVGTAVVRKGFDILLAAYRRAFTRDDDVALVIKDHSANAFHSPAYRDAIAAAMRDPGAPEVVYIDEFLPPEELAALYRACDAGVFPYRAEGFCLPILEAMACGVPSIVPNRGACLDFCSEETSMLVRALQIRFPVNRRFAMKIGVEEEIAAVDFCEIRVEDLTRALREVSAGGKKQLAAKAAAGVRTAHGCFTWERSAEVALQCLRELQGKVPLRFEQQRREAEAAYQRFETARRLLADETMRRSASRRRAHNSTPQP